MSTNVVNNFVLQINCSSAFDVLDSNQIEQYLLAEL